MIKDGLSALCTMVAGEVTTKSVAGLNKLTFDHFRTRGDLAFVPCGNDRSSRQ